MYRLLVFSFLAVVIEALAGCAAPELPAKYIYQAPPAGSAVASIRGSKTRDGTFCCEISTYVYSVDGKIVKDSASNALFPLPLEAGTKTLMLRADRRSIHSMVSMDVSTMAGQQLVAKAQWVESTGDEGGHCDFTVLDMISGREIATVKDGRIEGTGGQPQLLVPVFVPRK